MGVIGVSYLILVLNLVFLHETVRFPGLVVFLLNQAYAAYGRRLGRCIDSNPGSDLHSTL